MNFPVGWKASFSKYECSGSIKARYGGQLDIFKKNQKYRKQKQKKIFPWLLVVLGGGLLLLSAVLFANRSGGDGSGTPSIAVDQQRIDYGDVKFGVNKTFAIKVTNTGDDT